jgi:RND family efflux transporter MFP subunit
MAVPECLLVGSQFSGVFHAGIGSPAENIGLFSPTSVSVCELQVQDEPPSATSTPSPVNVLLPARRKDLVLRPVGADGSHVVKDPGSNQFFELGPHESFLLLALDGTLTAAGLRADFESRFGEPIDGAELQEFLELAHENGFLVPGEMAVPAIRSSAPARQSILFWRKTICDPDRVFSWLAPRLNFLWTRTFLVISAGAMLLALYVGWANRAALIGEFADAARWDVVLLAWATLIAATALHECAHGLTCKHFGGDVHEIGFLLLFFMPCFFCNVSDAWLFKERSKRLLVTFAGAYCDLMMWASAVLFWRVVQPGTLTSHLTWVVLTVCGGRVFFNLNPLLRLDGYYLLADALGEANLHQRGLDAWMGRVRRFLWGADAQEPEGRARLVLAYGAASYIYILALLALMFFGLARYAYWRWGLAALIVVLILAWLVVRPFLTGLFAGEVRLMIASRHKRLVVWLLILGGAAAGACYIQMNRDAAGLFFVRPLIRAEVHSPINGFLSEVGLDEGDRVSAGSLLVRLAVPDLESRLAQTRNEVLELKVRVDHCKDEVEGSQDDLERAEKLAKSSAGTQDEFRAAQRRAQACAAELRQTESRLASAQEHTKYLEGIAAKLEVRSPVAGLIMTPRLKERVGQYLHEGDLICVVEDPTILRAEVKLPEQEVELVRPGQRVELKARALPFDPFTGTVERLAPAVATDAGPASAGQNTVTVYVAIDGLHDDLKPGMTGHARVSCGRAASGRVLGEKFLRFLRTEFWW